MANRHFSRETLTAELAPQELIAFATAQANIGNTLDESVLASLQKLIDCAIADVDFHAAGVQIFKHDIVRLLTNRLRIQQALQEHPEILDEDVSDPIVIIGLGRSGTTKLHKMLSTSHDVQKTTFWRIWNPAQFPNTNPNAPDPRIEAANFSSLLTDDKPDMAAAHHIAHLEVEEDWLLYSLTFCDWIWNMTTPVPTYFDWVMRQPNLPTYQYIKQVLQYLQWQDGGKRGRPWILKAVGHLANLDALLQCYPNATIVHAHRDPLDTIPSWAKFQLGGWSIVANPIAKEAVGEQTLRCYKVAMDRYLSIRDRLQLDSRIIDVPYERIRSDPITIMQMIYRQAGRPLSADSEQLMRDWDRDNEQGRFGRHEYSLAEFGLNEQQIDSAFADYIRRFIHR